MTRFWALIIGVALSLVTVGGDVLVKQASLQRGLTGWTRLAAGAVFSVTCVLALTLISVGWFRERMTWPEGLGIGLACAALVLLARFA